MVSFRRLVIFLTTIGVFNGSSAESVKPQALARVGEEFKTAGIVPDVLPYFNPSALAYLTFSYPNGTSGTIASPSLRIGRDGRLSMR